METLDDLKYALAHAAWFSRLGRCPPAPGRVVLSDLRAWETHAQEVFTNNQPSVANAIDWLPTTRDQIDPIHGTTLKQIAQQRGRDHLLGQAVIDTYKTALVSLRTMPADHSLFRVGATNFAPAAHGAALYAVRQATAEIVVEQRDFWWALIPMYVQGYWPLGITDNRTLVIL